MSLLTMSPSSLLPVLSLLTLCLTAHAFLPPPSSRTSLRSLGPVTAEAGFNSPLPFPVSGSCTAGDTFTINSVDDLFANGKDLECIFAAGLPPANVPLGFGYGHIVSIANTAFWSPGIQNVYQGDFVVKTQCAGQFYNIGWLSIAGMDMGTSVWSLGSFPWTVAPGEYPLPESDYLVMDFTAKFEELCAAEGNESPLGLEGFSPFKSSMFPMNHFQDVGRVVGKDSDGGIIMLNKALINAPPKGAQTVLIYAVKTFDPSVFPGLTQDTVLTVPQGPNGESVIEYARDGVEGVVSSILSILLNPVALAREVARQQAPTSE